MSSDLPDPNKTPDSDAELTPPDPNVAAEAEADSKKPDPEADPESEEWDENEDLGVDAWSEEELEQVQPKPDLSTLPKATVPIELPEAPAAPGAPDAAPDQEQETQAQEDSADEPVAVEQQAPAAQESTETGDAKPASPGEWIRSLSVAEKACCLLIVLGIGIFGATVFLPALFDFDKPAGLTTSKDFPIKGKQVEVLSAESYWREPVLEGPDADKVRAGTAYVPVLDAKLKGSGEVRIFFRDGDGGSAGDPVSFTLSGELEISAVCTTGLENSGGLAAQRTDESKPWVAEFYEVEAEAEDVLLFKMAISPTEK